jgi:hypothetical protein
MRRVVSFLRLRSWRPFLRWRRHKYQREGRAGEADEEVGVSDEHRKALRNEGISDDCSPSSLINNYVVVSNLNAIGICLGDDDVRVDKSVSSIKEMVLGSKQECIPISLKDNVLEKEENVLLEEVEI